MGVKMIAKELEEYLLKRRREFAKKFGQEVNELGREEGIRFGDGSVGVKGILVTWMLTTDAIKEAAKQGCNLILCHEIPFFGEKWDRETPATPSWKVNEERKRLLSENGMTVFQCHATLDEILITDTFAEVLGLPKAARQEWRLRSVHEIAPIPLKKLARQVKKKMGLKIIRVVGDLNKKVSRVGLAYGGISLSVNLGFWEEMLKLNPDVVIGGETDEYAIRYAIENNLCVIETTHPISENPGLEKFCDELREVFPGVKIAFHRCGIPWEYV